MDSKDLEQWHRDWEDNKVSGALHEYGVEMTPMQILEEIK